MPINVNVAISETHWQLLTKIKQKLGLRNQAQAIERCIEIVVEQLKIEEK